MRSVLCRQQELLSGSGSLLKADKACATTARRQLCRPSIVETSNGGLHLSCFSRLDDLCCSRGVDQTMTMRMFGIGHAAFGSLHSLAHMSLLALMKVSWQLLDADMTCRVKRCLSAICSACDMALKIILMSCVQFRDDLDSGLPYT